MPFAPLRPLLAASIATLVLASPASARTVCIDVRVQAPEACEARVVTDGSAAARGRALQREIDAAEDAAGSDAILLGPGRYDQGSAAPAGGTGTFYYAPGGKPAGSLTVAGAASGVVLANSATAADDETVEGREAGAGGAAAPLILRDLTIEGPPNAAASLGLEVASPGSRLERIRIIGRSGDAPGALSAAVNARRAAAPARTASDLPVLTVESSIVQGFATLLQSTSCAATFSVVLLHVTTTDPVEAACPTGSAGTVQLTVERSVLLPGALLRAGASARVALASSRWDGPGSASGPGQIALGEGNTTADPQLDPATLAPRSSSPVIDAVEGPAAGGAFDVDGSPRVQDGDGDGRALPDMGAYEAAARRPTPTPIATPAPTPTPVVVPERTGPGEAPPVAPQPSTPPTPPGPAPTSTPAASPSPIGPGPQVEPIPRRAAASIKASALRLDARGRIRVRVRCAGATPAADDCRGKLRLQIRGAGRRLRTVASRSFTISAGKTRTVVLKPTSSVRRQVARRSLRLRARVTLRGPSDPVRSRWLTVRRAR